MISFIAEKCYDIFDDCEERVTDTLSCERDPELQRSCRMSCNLCNRQPATGGIQRRFYNL